VIRVAAVGDLHIGEDGTERWREALESVSGAADLLLLAGDLTRVGAREEGRLLLEVLSHVSIPTVAVLGNHDHHSGCEVELVGQLGRRGIRVLEGEACVVGVNGARIGVAGSKGFGGGFAGACGSEFGESEMKAFISHTRLLAERLGRALSSLDADLRLALLHYSPVEDTLVGEHPGVHPFLGSYLLAEAIDGAGAHLVVHGHAHAGSERGATPGGIPVRNVAQPVIRSAYRVYCFASPDAVECEDAPSNSGLDDRG
jgi:Icc-related predicted phosphoesterase